MAELSPARYSDEWEDTQKERFDKILNRDLDKLTRSSSTEFNFNEIRPRLDDVMDGVQLLAQNYDIWAHLSDTARSDVNAALEDMINQFDSMESFDPKQNGAWDIRNSLVTDFNNRFNSFYERITKPVGSYLGKKAYSEELASEFGKKAAEELKEIRKVKRGIDKIYNDVQDAAEVAGGVASTAHSVSFAEEASGHAVSARKWLYAVVGFGTFALIIAITVLYDIFKNLTDSSYKVGGEEYVIKVVILAFIYIGMRFTVRNYSAHQHLNIVNRHRANVLSSMEAFRTSAVDDPTKDQILLAAVGAAYSQQETGFITTKEGAGSEDGDILEIVKSVTKK